MAGDMNGDAPEDPRMANSLSRALGGEWLFERLPPWVVDTLTNDQKAAIHDTLRGPEWTAHSINIRLTIPFFGRYFYVTLVGGEGRRSVERRAHDRNRYPLRTFANAFFFVGIGALFYALSLLGLMVFSAIVEF